MGQELVQIATGIGTAHTNSTDEASLYRKEFKPGELGAGKIFEFAAGAIVSGNNSTDTVTPRLRWGPTSATPASNTALGAAAAVDSEDADMGKAFVRIVCESATRAVVEGYVTTIDAVPLATQFGPTVLTIDPTATYYLDYTADWSVAHAGNIIAAAFGYAKELA